MNYNILEFDSSNIKILNDIETISGKIKVNGVDKFQETSNFIISTSNIITNHIKNLNADDITNGTTNKYIINNTYSDELTVSGDFTVNGNIGIGTTPSRKLDVDGDIKFTGKLYQGDSEFITSYWLKNGNDIYISSNVTITGDLTVSGTTATINTDTYTTENLEIINNDTATSLAVTQLGETNNIFVASNISGEVFTIINNGKIGINNASPSVSLQVTGSDGIIVPVGTEGERPDPAIKGTIRYNDSTSQFEGYGTAWGSLGGVKDIDGDTYISAQGSDDDPLANTNQLKFITNDNVNMIIDSNGNVGIGSNITTPMSTLHIGGDIIATNKITSFYSDERLKTDIELIPDPLNIIEQLNGFYYKPNELANSFGIETKKRELGLSAQEVNKVLPELVDLAPLDIARDENNNIVSKSGENYLTVSYDKMIPVIIESIKKLNSEIKLLKEENLHLKEAIKKIY